MSRCPIFRPITALILVAAFFRCAVAETPLESPPSPFRITPEKVIEQLRDCGLVQMPLATAQRQLLADARDGELDEFSLADAVLIASGATERADRDKYLTRLEPLEKRARKELAGAETEFGGRLLKFLHRHPMSAGYSTEQPDVHTLLDTGKFNCVSSSVLFNVLASRLGVNGTLKVQRPAPELCNAGLVAGMIPGRRCSTPRRRASSRWSIHRSTGDLFLNQAAPLMRDGQLEKALAVVDRGLDKVDGAAKGPLQQWRDGHVRNHVIRLMRSRLMAAQYDAALSAITSHAELLGDKELTRNLQCEVYDAWATKFIAKQEWQSAIDVYVAAVQKLRPQTPLPQRSRMLRPLGPKPLPGQRLGRCDQDL